MCVRERERDRESIETYPLPACQGRRLEMGGGGGDGSQDPQIPAWWEVPDSHPKEASDALEASWVGLEESSLSADGQGDLMPQGSAKGRVGGGDQGARNTSTFIPE